MWKRILPACALILLGSGCTTPQPLTAFPQPPDSLLAPCERPQPLSGHTAAQALATVTGNYARHHRCADTADALQEWVRGQAAVKP